MMRHLTVVGDLAAQSDPTLAGRFAHPVTRVPNKTFITAARSMLQAATDQKDALLAVGLGDKFLDEFGQAITEFDTQVGNGNSGRRQHIGARADLLAVADDVLQQIHVLDGLIRSEYRNDPELLAAWTSARNVVRPIRAGRPRKPAPASGPVSAPAPAVQPVAGPQASGGDQAGGSGPAGGDLSQGSDQESKQAA